MVSAVKKNLPREESPGSTYPTQSSSAKDFSYSDIAKKIKFGDLKIAIYGLGHVGSPMASVWLRAGAHVIGVDKSATVLERARKGESHVPEPGVNDAFRTGLATKRFEIYTDPAKASHDSYFKMICVPVLLSDNSTSPDLTAVKDVSTAIGKGLKKGDVVALNPSVPPGTTENVVLPILQKESGLEVENDFYMIYNPERIYEGRAIQDIEERYPAVISGAGPKSLEIGKIIYSLIFKKGVFPVSNIRTAETEKLLEGVYRDVNIALANELAKFCEKVGVNFWESRDAANSQPFCHIHSPGVGVGGACIPVYPQFILYTSDQVKANCDITKLGRAVNDAMPAYCVLEAMKLLDGNKKMEDKSLARITVTLLGLAFRGGVSDTRLSPTYEVIKQFQKRGIKEIRVHDPLVKNDPLLLKHQNVSLFSNLARALEGTDLVMIVADHAEYRALTPDRIGWVPIYDGRGILDTTVFTSYATLGIGNSKY
ncbi:MAG TPA: nucleotide sugar dehydrogenase [Candidatus Nitrosopolaris sp.]|nr:nucleotide sugar dehydrogenase [Candidatus Nitrosopolaris sp.]